MDPKEQFWRDFHIQVAAISDSIGRLGSVAAGGSERKKATDSVLASISKLSHDVADAAEYIPAYDQRLYAESVKTLTNRLNSELARTAPKARFQFKRTAKPQDATATAEVADPRLLRGIAPVATAADNSHKADTGDEPAPDAKDYNAAIAAASGRLRTPSFSTAREIAITGHAGLHIVLPPAAAHATASGSLTDLTGCVVDMAVPTAARPFLSLMLKNIRRSLLVVGHVSGPAHITGLRNCVVVVASRQVRIHECVHVDLYLHSGSRPIIEDCQAMRFAPLPACYMNEADQKTTNQWDQVDDFKWLKADHSPNWSVLPETERLSETVWTDVVAGESGLETEAVLQGVGIGEA